MQPIIIDSKEVFGRWELSKADQLAVLGLPANFSLSELHTLDQTEVEQVTARSACITSLDRSLNILYPSQDLVKRWLTQPNSHPLFDHQAPLDLLKSGDLDVFRQIAQLMSAWSAGNY